MKSMIKRKVEISLTAHIEMVQQLILDAYEIQKDRQSRGGVTDPTCPGNILYYRMLRQTGHTAALKKILSYDFQTENNLNIMGVFHSVRERDSFFHSRAGADVSLPDVDKKQHTTTISHYMGTGIDKANIIVFSDTLHDPKRLASAHEMLREGRTAFTNLTLVVFLG